MRQKRTGKKGACWILGLVVAVGAWGRLGASSVKIWQEPLIIPTYAVGQAERNPIFFNGRAYQGAQGPVYPYALIDKLSDQKVPKSYNAIYLENEFVKVCVLPEIGGRIFSAVDKTNGYDFVYRQNVIKPALIGMLGAWISGGIEWNVLHHHRATTFMDVDFETTRNDDGSMTAWVGEIELRHRMKWLVGVSLHPESSRIGIDVKIWNRTPVLHSILYFANAAVHVNPDYQVVFPPRTTFATHHGKNQFSNWPVADGPFVGIDYERGTDLSWWKNHPAAVSFFAWNEHDDFLAGYDHGKDAGVVSVADHRQVPGKKFFEWGTGASGKMWEKILTDKDGPYLELMVGAYSDNQPDYSWIQPYEAKVFRQYWYPVQKIGGVKTANLNGAANLEVTPEGKAFIGFCTTSSYRNAEVLLRAGEKIAYRQTIDIDPFHPYQKIVDLPEMVKKPNLAVSLVSADGVERIAYGPAMREERPMPLPVISPPPPQEIETVEKLYLTGLRLAQFYNPALDPVGYFEEALRRDPGDTRVNTFMGILFFKRGMFKEAEEKFNVALKRLTWNYTRPRDGEAYYYLGLSLRAQGRTRAAIDSFARAAWSQAWYSAANHQLAEMACSEGDYSEALIRIEKVVRTNEFNTKGRDLKSALLRRLGRWEDAEQTADDVLTVDPLDSWARNEKYLCVLRKGPSDRETQEREVIERQMRGVWQSYLELASDYGNCGLFDEAAGILSRFRGVNKSPVNPLILYHLGYYLEKNGDTGKGTDCYRLAYKMPFDYCFPFQLESMAVLERVSECLPSDARPHYLLGNLLYDSQPQRAIAEWEKAANLDSRLATVFRNLGLAYARTGKDLASSVLQMKKAVSLSPSDPRLFYELDLVSEAAGVPAVERLKKLEKSQPVVMKSDDALTRLIMLLVQVGRYDRALNLLDRHHFHVWEGGGGIHDVFVDAHLLRGLIRYERGRYREALLDFQAALAYPDNLEVGRPYRGGREAQIFYWIGLACSSLGDEVQARDSFQKSVQSRSDPSEASECSDLDYYRAMSLKKLGEEEKGIRILSELQRVGEARVKVRSGLDYFAKFGEQQSEFSRVAQLHYCIGLGTLGLGDRKKAAAEFAHALQLNPNHAWALFQLRGIK